MKKFGVLMKEFKHKQVQKFPPDFRYRVLRISSGLDQQGALRWDLALCLLLAWVICYLCVCKGVKSSGKVSDKAKRVTSDPKNSRSNRIFFFFPQGCVLHCDSSLCLVDSPLDSGSNFAGSCRGNQILSHSKLVKAERRTGITIILESNYINLYHFLLCI